MNIMPIDEAKKRQQHDEYLKRLWPMGKEVWRPELTEEERRKLQEEIDAGIIPF